MRTDAFGAKRVTSRDYSRFWAQSPGWQPGRKGAVRGLLQVEEWHVRALQGCILGMLFFLHGDILSQIVLPPDFLGRFTLWKKRIKIIDKHQPRYPVCIASHRKPRTVLRRLAGYPKKWRSSHFFRETRAVLPRTVFSEMPCLKLSVDSYK